MTTTTPTAALVNEIETLVRARYPILYLLASEELRADEALAEWRDVGKKRFLSGVAPVE